MQRRRTSARLRIWPAAWLFVPETPEAELARSWSLPGRLGMPVVDDDDVDGPEWEPLWSPVDARSFLGESRRECVEVAAVGEPPVFANA
jgi:hypothetical protein